MAECNLNCSPVGNCKKCTEAKSFFEGESCALLYNDEEHWFDDEDEEFVFNGSNQWFEDAHRTGLKEQHDMEFGYRRAKREEQRKMLKRKMRVERRHEKEENTKDKRYKEK
jgi:hypothetical protein